MPPKSNTQQRKKLRTDSIFYIWDDPLLFRKGADMIIRRCIPKKKNNVEFLINVMHQHMEDTLEEKEQLIKFSNQVFIGLLYSKTVLNG